MGQTGEGKGGEKEQIRHRWEPAAHVSIVQSCANLAIEFAAIVIMTFGDKLRSGGCFR